MIKLEIKERYKEWGLEAATAAGCLLLAYFLMVGPAFQKMDDLHEDAKTLKEKAGLCQNILVLRNRLKELEASFMTVENRSIVIARVSDLANKYGIDVRGITPRTEPGTQYMRLRLTVDARCSFFGLLQYLGGLENLVPSVNVREISVSLGNAKPSREANENNLAQETESGPEQGKKPKLFCRIIAETFLKQKTVKS